MTTLAGLHLGICDRSPFVLVDAVPPFQVGGLLVGMLDARILVHIAGLTERHLGQDDRMAGATQRRGLEVSTLLRLYGKARLHRIGSVVVIGPVHFGGRTDQELTRKLRLTAQSLGRDVVANRT